MRMHDMVMVGKVNVRSLDDSELLDLYKFKRGYRPHFDVFTLCNEEIRRRREERTKE